MEQRTKEWHKARLGIPTASNFRKIITAEGRPSKSATEYMCRLIGERIFERSMEERVTNKWMAHGIATEDLAAQEFAAISNERLENVGFVTTPDGRLGCSPDRLIVSKNAALEIKCPAPWTHIEYLLYGPGTDYKQQVQGQMLVGGYDKVYFFSYFPGMPAAMFETERDDSFIVKLGAALALFCDNLDKGTKKFRELGEIDYALAMSTIETLMPEEYFKCGSD